MRRQTIGLSVLAVIALSFTVTAEAQNGGLRQRLENMRNDLLGQRDSREVEPRTQSRPVQSRSVLRNSSPVNVQLGQASRRSNSNNGEQSVLTQGFPQRVPRRVKPTAPVKATDVASKPATVVKTAASPSNRVSVAQQSSRRTGRMVVQPDASPALAEPGRIVAQDATIVNDASATAASVTKIEVPSKPTGPKIKVEKVPVYNQPASRPISSTPVLSPSRARPIAKTPVAPKRTTRDDLLIARKSALLSVETLGPRKTIIGRESTFKVQVRNLGEVAADGVVIQVATPPWAEIIAAQPSQGATDTVSSDPLVWRVENVAPRSQEELTLKIVPRRSDAFDLGVSWAFKPGAAQTLIEVQEPQLELSIGGPREVRFGDTEVYSLNVSNPGTGVAENVEVQLMPLDGSERPMAVQKVGNVPAGGNKVLEVELTARQPGYVTISATAAGDMNLHADATEKVLVRRAALAVEVVAPPAKYTGTVATFKFRVSNTGNDTAEKIRLTATLPPGVEYIESSHGGRLNAASSKVGWTLSSLPAQHEQVFTIKGKVTQHGPNVLQVNAVADRDLADAGTATTFVQALADLKLDVTDPRGPIPINEDIVYEIRIRNRGSKAAREVEIVTFFSEGVEPISVHGANHQMGSGQVVFDPIPSLAVGDEVVYKIVARANRGGDHIFRAEVQCREANTRLAEEETTHFFDESTATAQRPEYQSQPTPVGGYEPLSR